MVEGTPTCPFDNIAKNPNTLVRYRGIAAIAASPGLVPGHVLIIPEQHYDTTTQLPDELLARLDVVTQHVTRTIGRVWPGIVFGFEHGSQKLQQVLHAHRQIMPGVPAWFDGLVRRVDADLTVLDNTGTMSDFKRAHPQHATHYAAVTTYGENGASTGINRFYQGPNEPRPGYIRKVLAEIIGLPALGDSRALGTNPILKDATALWAAATNTRLQESLEWQFLVLNL